MSSHAACQLCPLSTPYQVPSALFMRGIIYLKRILFFPSKLSYQRQRERFVTLAGAYFAPRRCMQFSARPHQQRYVVSCAYARSESQAAAKVLITCYAKPVYRPAMLQDLRRR